MLHRRLKFSNFCILSGQKTAMFTILDKDKAYLIHKKMTIVRCCTYFFSFGLNKRYGPKGQGIEPKSSRKKQDWFYLQFSVRPTDFSKLSFTNRP
jgi:hypothetical protein